VSAADAAVGETVWALHARRGVLRGVLLVMLAMGLVGSWWALLALPAAVLIGFAFAAVGLAASTFLRGWQDFEFVQIAILPLFLFSTTFYPLSTYPRPLQVLVECTPLYHGIELVRGAVTGDVRWALLGSAAYLLVMGVAGWRSAPPPGAPAAEVTGDPGRRGAAGLPSLGRPAHPAVESRMRLHRERSRHGWRVEQLSGLVRRLRAAAPDVTGVPWSSRSTARRRR
jgi:hypothetical protein